ncbi:hypothetical protein OHC33_008986 [Knufia fluminis]|uniref:Major facilitator superfamily (MFS) profile domain-containing protein n=1 Tax=Knufia fluminis TaxID=191047 RepID=A0AAN8EHY0_9EURO|nr:hypothetical protein OHC33_008986 [Knufia fluminis]
MAIRVRRAVNNIHWFIDQAEHRREARNPRQGRRLTYEAIEAGGNNYLIVLVAGLGFFTDSYLLFASNSINPMVGYIYWNNATTASHEMAVNLATLGGCVLGMVLFGWLSDTFGRRKIYGHELLLLIVGTIGVVMSSPGYALSVGTEVEADRIDWSTYGSMDVVSWLTFWRFITGVGLGGDYPLSATIVSEFAPTRRRARMLAAVFSGQAFGYMTANLVSLVVTMIVRDRHPVPSPRSVDQIWRWVIGLSLIPAFAAAILRLTIPESPRYTLDVSDNITKAFEETNRFNAANLEPAWVKQANIDTVGAAIAADNDDFDGMAPSSAISEEAVDVIDIDQSKIQAKQYFFNDGNWILLLGTGLCWFLLDIGFYALSLNSPQTVSKLWYQNADQRPDRPVWDTNLDVEDPEAGIYTILITNSTHAMVISSIGAITGALIMIYLIDKVNRRKFQLASFLVLASLFIITGATFSSTVQTGFHGVTITLFVLCQLAFYCGPNTLTFVIPAELFPTKYRATCHGISAAAGKVGSMITTIFLAYVKFSSGSNEVKSSDPKSKWLGWVLMIFSLPMVVGAGFTWWLIPDVQYRDRKNKSLEELVFVRQRQFARTQNIQMSSEAVNAA